MSKLIRDHLRGNVVGYIALFCFAIGGTAYATHPGGVNTISSGDIIDGQVDSVDVATLKSVDIGTGEIRTADVANDTTANALTGADIADDSLTGTDVAPNSLTGADIADTGSLGTLEINEGNLFNDNSLTEADLASNAVGTLELQDFGVTNAKLGSGAVEAENLDTFSVSENKILPQSITSSKIRANAVEQSEIATNAVAGAELEDGAVADELSGGAVRSSEFGVMNERTGSVVVPDGSVAALSVNCAGGEQLITSGFSAHFRTTVVHSRRSSTGWVFIFFNSGGFGVGDQSATGYVYCLVP